METFKIAIAIFVKTPGLSPLKTRLARSIGVQEATDFYRKSLCAVGEVVASFAEEKNRGPRVRIFPYFAVAEEEGVKDPLWQDFPVLTQGSGSLGKRLHTVSQRLFEDHDGVFFLGADAPQISLGLLNRAAKLLEEHPFVVGPARDGGFYLYGCRQHVPLSTWESVTYSQKDTLKELCEGFSHHGLDAKKLETLRDVDEMEDLSPLLEQLSSMPSLLSTQMTLCRWLATRS